VGDVGYEEEYRRPGPQVERRIPPPV